MSEIYMDLQICTRKRLNLLSWQMLFSVHHGVTALHIYLTWGGMILWLLYQVAICNVPPGAAIPISVRWLHQRGWLTIRVQSSRRMSSNEGRSLKQLWRKETTTQWGQLSSGSSSLLLLALPFFRSSGLRQVEVSFEYVVQRRAKIPSENFHKLSFYEKSGFHRICVYPLGMCYLVG